MKNYIIHNTNTGKSLEVTCTAIKALKLFDEACIFTYGHRIYYSLFHKTEILNNGGFVKYRDIYVTET